MKKYILLVAGYSYSGDGTDFGYIADKRRKYILQQNPTWENDTNVVFKRFDVKAGKIDSNTSDGTNRKWVEETSRFTPINRRSHYTDRQFISASNDVMSIKDVYDYVIQIGDTEAGTIQELSIMGHGWMGGPVLVNSYERADFQVGGSRASERDPFDKDGRIKDFLLDNMDADSWAKFKAAFNVSAYVWVWGCVFTRAYFNTLYTFMRSNDFRRKRFGTHIDSDTFTVTVNANFVSKYYSADRRFFPLDDNERRFTRSLAQLKAFLIGGMIQTYCGRLTADTGIECRGAMIGTYSDYERTYPGHNPRHTVMIIPRNVGAYGTDFTSTINFYKTYLNVTEDPESRGYGIFTSTQVNAWWATNPPV